MNLDCVVLDLEDGVAINQKENARKLILQSLKTKKFGRAGILYYSIVYIIVSKYVVIEWEYCYCCCKLH